MTDIGWKFPRTDGGVESGINDAGIVTFDGAPLPSLAREVIQNSVDARDNLAEPVHITFELRPVPTSEIGGNQLAQHLDECIVDWSSDQKARDALQNARSTLDNDEVNLLGVLDRNTTGLLGETWRGLVKVTGASFKRSDDAGGSFGVGKAAPFTVSPLRAVFYWSAFREEGRTVEQFQGKAVLVSHTHDFGEGPETTQNVGFYGLPDGCQALRTDIPSVFRHTESGRPVQGTAVWVAGFKPDQHGEQWQTAVRRSVLENFFYAIHQNDLEVLLEPGGDNDVLNSGTLSRQFDLLVDPDEDLEDGDAIDRARLYWELVRSGPPTVETLVADLGSIKIWIATEEDLPDRTLPNRVALIRGTGMVVTDQQEGHRFRGLRDYVAVCVIEDEEANRLLRRMENPAHDKFEYQRLPDHEQDRGRLALDRLRKAIREQLGIFAARPEIEVSDVIDELTEYLFDDRPGPFDGVTNRDGAEAAFGQVGAITRRQPRLRVRPQVTLSREEEDLDGGDGDDSGEVGGARQGPGGGVPGENGNGGGAGEGDGSGGTGRRGGSRGRQLVELEDVRVLHDPTNPKKATVLFTAPATLSARLLIDEAGDASAIQREDLSVFDEHGELLNDAYRTFEAGVRYALTISGEHPLSDAAWQVAAVVEDRA
ncbi:MAG: hypothetical protein OXH38_01745 [Chloroflexi bacterium]|nr:hypothetical protein [Chloroflexota bacterium]